MTSFDMLGCFKSYLIMFLCFFTPALPHTYIYRRQTLRKHFESVFTAKPVIHTRLKYQIAVYHNNKEDIIYKTGTFDEKRNNSYCLLSTLFLFDVKKFLFCFNPVTQWKT